MNSRTALCAMGVAAALVASSALSAAAASPTPSAEIEVGVPVNPPEGVSTPRPLPPAMVAALKKATYISVAKGRHVSGARTITVTKGKPFAIMLSTDRTGTLSFTDQSGTVLKGAAGTYGSVLFTAKKKGRFALRFTGSDDTLATVVVK